MRAEEGLYERTLQTVLREQQPDGLWRSLYEGGPVHVSTGLIATNLLESPDPARFEVEAQLVSGLLALQQASGGFAGYAGGSVSRDVTRIAALALRVFRERNVAALEARPALRNALSASLRRARRCIRWMPWLTPSPFLDFIADLLWDSVYPGESNELLPNPVAAELAHFVLRSHWTREVRKRVSSFARQALPAIGVLVETASHRAWWSRAFDQLQELLGLESSATTLARLESELLSTQAKNGGWLWTVFGTSLNLLALRSLGRDRSHPAVQQGLAFIHSLRMTDGEGQLRQSWCNAELWDACVASNTLLVCGVAPSAMQTRALTECVLQEQGRDGLWAFGLGAIEGDNDSSSMVLTWLTRVVDSLDGELRARAAEAIRLGTIGLLRGQQRDGGWGYSPAPNEAPWGFGPRSPFGLESTLVDASTPDVVGRVMGSLLAARGSGVLSASVEREVGHSFSRGVHYLRASQSSTGSWQGRWITGHLSTLPFILPMLRAGGQDMEEPWIVRARDFVRTHQNPDGGWGETTLADSEPSRAGKGSSTPVQTAFGLAALVACSGDTPDFRIASAVSQLRRQSAWKNPRALYTVAFRDDYFDAPLMTGTMVLTMLRYEELSRASGPGEASEALIIGSRATGARQRG